MFNNYINLLAISVSSLEDPAQSSDGKQKIIWIVVLAIVIIACIALSRIDFKIGDKVKAKKEEKERKNAEKIREAELERLHEIKRKNQRK